VSDWPQEIAKPRVLANFKNRGARERHSNSERYKDRAGMSDAHLALVRQLPCCVCSRDAPSDPHHLKSGTGERGAGLRSTDKWAVPLCRNDHDEVERIGTKNERQWFLDRGVDPHELAQGLWASPDLSRMQAVMLVHAELRR